MGKYFSSSRVKITVDDTVAALYSVDSNFSGKIKSPVQLGLLFDARYFSVYIYITGFSQFHDLKYPVIAYDIKPLLKRSQYSAEQRFFYWYFMYRIHRNLSFCYHHLRIFCHSMRYAGVITTYNN